MRKSIWMWAMLWCVGAVWPTLSWAALAGNPLRLDYLYPTVGDSLASIVLVPPFSDLPYTCCISNEFSPQGSMLLISVGDDTIVIEGERSQVFTPADFNGLSFFDVAGTIEAISAATLVESTLPGLDAGDVTFTPDRVLIDFAGASALNLESWRVVVRLGFGGAVPEPGSLALGGLGLLLLGRLQGRGRAAATRLTPSRNARARPAP